MKYAALLALLFSVTSCSSRVIEAIKPNHVGITPSYEWELQDGAKPKHKPKISTTVDWNF